MGVLLENGLTVFDMFDRFWNWLPFTTPVKVIIVAITSIIVICGWLYIRHSSKNAGKLIFEKNQLEGNSKIENVEVNKGSKLEMTGNTLKGNSSIRNISVGKRKPL